MIRELQNHFIVCGFGRVGRNASFELQRGKFPFVAVDRSEQRVQRATMAGMRAVLADATRDECLRDVGVTRTRGLIAALPSDAENLFIILCAKALNPNLTIATRASEEEAEQMLRRAGADTVFAPYNDRGKHQSHRLPQRHASKINSMFSSNQKSVAVIGATAKAGHVSRAIHWKLISSRWRNDLSG
jgi:voltage-gated potassium channel